MFVLSRSSCRSSRGDVRKCHKVNHRYIFFSMYCGHIGNKTFPSSPHEFKRKQEKEPMICLFFYSFYIYIFFLVFHSVKPYLTSYGPQQTVGSQSTDVSPRVTLPAVSCCSNSLNPCAAGPNKWINKYVGERSPDERSLIPLFQREAMNGWPVFCWELKKGAKVRASEHDIFCNGGLLVS